MKKILVRVLIGLAILIAIPFVAALFMDKDMNLQREIIINKPKQVVFDYVKQLKNEDNYNTWVMMDPSMKKEYKGTDGTVGFVYSWNSESNDVGEGEQEITKIVDGQRMDFELRFKRPFAGTDHGFLTTEAVGEDKTRVTSNFVGQMAYPMNLMGAWCKDMMGKEMQKSLDNLKNVLEKA